MNANVTKARFWNPEYAATNTIVNETWFTEMELKKKRECRLSLLTRRLFVYVNVKDICINCYVIP